MNARLQTLIERYPDLEGCRVDIQHAFECMLISFQRGGTLLICGNGGSAADGEHLVGELMKSFCLPRPLPTSLQGRLRETFPDEVGAYLATRLQGALPTLTLSAHTALTTAIANDVAADLVFAQQVLGYGQAGDVLLAISTSGRSANVLQAVRLARTLGLRTVGLTGADGGELTSLCDVTIRVPYHTVVEVQERHLPIYHTLALMLEDAFFGADLAVTSQALHQEPRAAHLLEWTERQEGHDG